MSKTGQMYDWITNSFNPIGGECPHICSYCYVKKFRFPSLKEKYSGPPRLYENELKRNLGKDKFWFVGSCLDMFANDIPPEWISKTLEHCRKFNNKYLFQTKNPGGLLFWLNNLPLNAIVGTTIETNRRYPQMGNAPWPMLRAHYMEIISKFKDTMVTVEPVMRFDLMNLVELAKQCNPEWVNIGADSQKSKLIEPNGKEVRELINELEKFTKVKVKKNLKRLYENETN